MATAINTVEKVDKQKNIPTYQPSDKEKNALKRMAKNFTSDRLVIFRAYNQFNNRSLFDSIDDWAKRWNGYIPPNDLISGNPTSNIFLNFTRNVIIGYLAKVAMELPEPKITAVNKKTGLVNKRLADVLADLNEYSLNEENGPARLLETALECTVKGTAIVYEGYLKNEQKIKSPIEWDEPTGKIETERITRTLFDNCFQMVIPLEDFYPANPYEPDMQKQPHVIWRKITTYSEAWNEFSHYSNWKYVKPGGYTMTAEPTTFYRNNLYTELANEQVEILRYYNRKDNEHIVTVNGVIMYQGAIPFKDGRYPFAKYIFEPFENAFFWGAGAPNKFMGEQDVQNTLINMMLDKTYGSLLPYGLSSDLDDLIEDDTLAPNKIRKVSDINKWKFDVLPGVSGGEQQMFQVIMNLARENSGLVGAGQQFSPRGGKLNVRQVLLAQQEAMQKLTFNMNFLEDGERDRTELRLSHILQFYAIPKIERVTGKNGKEIEQLVYRDVKLNDVGLSNGQRGSKIIKLTDDATAMNPDMKQQMADKLSVLETAGEMTGTPTEALALPISMFENHSYQVQIVKGSSYERNQALDQAMRQEYAQWRLSLAQIVPVNASELVRWVDEAYDIDPERFAPQGTGQPNPLQPNAQQTQQQVAATSGGAAGPVVPPSPPQSQSSVAPAGLGAFQ